MSGPFTKEEVHCILGGYFASSPLSLVEKARSQGNTTSYGIFYLRMRMGTQSTVGSMQMISPQSRVQLHRSQK